MNNSAVWEGKQGSLGQKTDYQIAQAFTEYQHRIALRVSKEFEDKQKDLLQEAVFENYSYCWFSSLLCLLSLRSFLSALSSYTNSIDLILSVFKELFE